MKQYSIFTVTDESYKYYTEVFFKSLNKINMDLVKNVYVCDQGMSEGQRDFVNSFDKVQIINPVNKINEKTEIVWDKTWLKKVGSKTENLLKLVEDNDEPIVMIDVDSMFIKDFYDLLDFDKDVQVAHRPPNFPDYIASFVSINKKSGVNFISRWIHNINNLAETPKETRALCNTINEYKKSSEDFIVGDLPVEQIHFYGQESECESNNTRIAHFKGWSKTKYLGTKDDFHNRTSLRGYDERLKEYINV
tara:strand:- start:137 stop:883 length:747 start_codon:yes stop_codon:yes gene_type:complete